jgi:ribose transport system permease protein
MTENLTGLLKILGITLLLLLLWVLLSWYVPERFLGTNNIENLMRRTALFGVLGIGVAFVIISGGIDLSIGALVCLSACLLGLFLHVDYLDVGAGDVLSVNAETKTITIDGPAELQAGDQAWYFKDRRNNGLLKIVSVTDAKTAGQVAVVVEGELKRDQISEDGKPIGTLAKAFPVVSFAEKSATLAAEFPRLKHNDKIKFVSPDSSPREKQIDLVADDGTITLSDTAPSVTEEFFAVPVRRTPRMSIPLAILSVLGIAALLGLIHGWLITKMNLQPFVVTLCGLLIYRGLSRWFTDDQTVGFIEYQETLGKIATGRWELWQSVDGSESFGIPYAFFIFVAFTILAIVFLNLTVAGRHLLAIGRNEEAARYSGINTHRIVLLAYVLCALLAAIGGIMFAIDSNSVAPSSFGNFYELYAIAAAVLGGCSLRGGEGSILGVVVGTALMQTLYASIVLLKIPNELEFSLIGIVILLGVIGDELLRRFMGRMGGKKT